MATTVPICSAVSTGCHNGTRKRQPEGRLSHSARMRPNIGRSECKRGGRWSGRSRGRCCLARPAAARVCSKTDLGPSLWSSKMEDRADGDAYPHKSTPRRGDACGRMCPMSGHRWTETGRMVTRLLPFASFTTASRPELVTRADATLE